MDYVKEIPHATAWVRKSGVYRSAPLYQRRDTLFAELSGGFIRLHAAGATSVPTVVWLELDPGVDYKLTHTDRQAPRIEPIKQRVKKAA